VNSGPHLSCTTSAVAHTQSLAASMASVIQEGDLLVLVGDLGAGKTAFTQGLARALGVDEPVTSPTFTLANRYEGDMAVNHLDVYRLESLAEAADLAIDELLDDGVTLVEWGDIIRPTLPEDRLEVRIRYEDGDDDRRLDFTLVGPRWTERRDALAAALETWTS
jgi:tRNA threonylcarbamoyladenosine biosynthesis protein TsaE